MLQVKMLRITYGLNLTNLMIKYNQYLSQRIGSVPQLQNCYGKKTVLSPKESVCTLYVGNNFATCSILFTSDAKMFTAKSEDQLLCAITAHQYGQHIVNHLKILANF